MLSTTPDDTRRLSVLTPLVDGDPYWVLLLLPRDPAPSYEVYRTVRRNFLEACCMVVRLDHPDAKDIVGFATETRGGQGRSEDALYLDTRHWTVEMNEHARDLKQKWNILTAATQKPFTLKEYPSSE
jgi:hypothetical protein